MDNVVSLASNMDAAATTTILISTSHLDEKSLAAANVHAVIASSSAVDAVKILSHAFGLSKSTPATLAQLVWSWCVSVGAWMIAVSLQDAAGREGCRFHL
jgi:hypothetical protein